MMVNNEIEWKVICLGLVLGVPLLLSLVTASLSSLVESHLHQICIYM